jgi:hypothetical protein
MSDGPIAPLISVNVGLQRDIATQTTLYDGSWAEYASQPNAIIEKTLNVEDTVSCEPKHSIKFVFS